MEQIYEQKFGRRGDGDQRSSGDEDERRRRAYGDGEQWRLFRDGDQRSSGDEDERRRRAYDQWCRGDGEQRSSGDDEEWRRRHGAYGDVERRLFYDPYGDGDQRSSGDEDERRRRDQWIREKMEPPFNFDRGDLLSDAEKRTRDRETPEQVTYNINGNLSFKYTSDDAGSEYEPYGTCKIEVAGKTLAVADLELANRGGTRNFFAN